jgi:hypothetical protein
LIANSLFLVVLFQLRYIESATALTRTCPRKISAVLAFVIVGRERPDES